MKLIRMLVSGALVAPLCAANAASPGDAPPLPITGARVVNVATEPQLQAAMGNLQNGDTLLLADGTYDLTASLYINGRHNITVRGASGSTNVVLAGQGMDKFERRPVRHLVQRHQHDRRPPHHPRYLGQ